MKNNYIKVKLQEAIGDLEYDLESIEESLSSQRESVRYKAGELRRMRDYLKEINKNKRSLIRQLEKAKLILERVK